MDELVSVIVPIYKKQDTLERCLKSILVQDYNNIEIILVDDGSPDRCGEICERYAKMDQRIRVIHQMNRGVSIARNCGINISNGEYITFVDADDIICPSFISKYISLFDNNVDIVVGAARKIKERFIRNYSKVKAVEAMFEDDIFGVQVWAKLYRKDLIKDVTFPEGVKIGEDLQFLFDAIIKSHSIVYFSENLYQQNLSQYNSATFANINHYMKAAEICLLCRNKAINLKMNECIRFIEKGVLIRIIFVWNLMCLSRIHDEDLYKNCLEIIYECKNTIEILDIKYKSAVWAIIHAPKLYKLIIKIYWRKNC